jgi:predicted DCC family thiol-disulfide oxidoreductase YuxK
MDYHNKQILYFDGVCNLCETAVQFVIKRNKQENILFASLQSSAGQKMLIDFNLPQQQLFSMVFVDRGELYIKSSASLRITKYLAAAWPICQYAKFVPRFIRDVVYDWVARNRYKWFGEKNACWLPTKELEKRFL